jgi:Flp pilus assembly protein protease CpaA
MEILLIRIASVAIMATAYMIFDVFNNRNVPGIFAYATLAYGAVLTLLYLNATAISISCTIALVILGIGYAIYRMGLIGAADVMEFAALSLIIPVQPAPLLMMSQAQFGIPFVISVLIGSGIAALVIVPLYYIPKARGAFKNTPIRSTNVVKAAAIAGAYLLFFAALEYTAGITMMGVIILAVLFVGSATITLFEDPITKTMVEYANVDRFEEGDLIALNLMSRQDVESAKRHIRHFDRLVTEALIKEMHKKHIRQKFPVYKSALPLALPIFIGVVVSLLFGNILIFLLPGL